MSPPETNDLVPAPESTITRIALSARKSSITSAAAIDISSENALCFSGLLKIRWPTGPSFFERTLLSVRVSVVIFVELLNNALGPQLRELRIRVADAAQDLVGILPRFP